MRMRGGVRMGMGMGRIVRSCDMRASELLMA